jgi:methylated-DNA-[protein]-cysteine S-methyltransferase
MTAVTTAGLMHDRWPSPLGPLDLVFDDEGRLHALEFGGEPLAAGGAGRRRRRASWPDLREASAPDAIVVALTAYFAGEIGALDAITIQPSGTPFQQAVWAALRTIRPGTTSTYGRLAAQIGRPGAGRAVGLANGSNPIGIVVPCHRVIGGDGSLTGYGGGMDRKRWLLDHERRWSAGGI